MEVCLLSAKVLASSCVRLSSLPDSWLWLCMALPKAVSYLALKSTKIISAYYCLLLRIYSAANSSLAASSTDWSNLIRLLARMILLLAILDAPLHVWPLLYYRSYNRLTESSYFWFPEFLFSHLELFCDLKFVPTIESFGYLNLLGLCVIILYPP